jgi:hypothetical protein
VTDFDVVRLDDPDDEEQYRAGALWGHQAPAIVLMRTITAPLAGLYKPFRTTKYPVYA